MYEEYIYNHSIMKKILILSLICIFSFGLAGCSWFSTPELEGGGGVSPNEDPTNYPPAPNQ